MKSVNALALAATLAACFIMFGCETSTRRRISRVSSAVRPKKRPQPRTIRSRTQTTRPQPKQRRHERRRGRSCRFSNQRSCAPWEVKTLLPEKPNRSKES